MIAADRPIRSARDYELLAASTGWRAAVSNIDGVAHGYKVAAICAPIG